MSPAPKTSQFGIVEDEPGEFKTLNQFILERQEEFPHSTGALSRLLRDLSLAAKIVSRDMRQAGLTNISGGAGTTNVQGEAQQKMDVLAHREFVRALRRGGECRFVGSEEDPDLISLPPKPDGDGKYVVLLDPLDGSSNLDVGVSVGTIFSIYRMPEEDDGSESTPKEVVLLPGTEQVAAGYVLYGTSTMLVYTTGYGVNGFTLEPSIGEFLLSHPDIRLPTQERYFSINIGYSQSFDEGVRAYLDWLQERDPETNRPAKIRYVGTFVSDAHRTLLKGGIYMYPVTEGNPRGKLRLMYEANPMAFIAEQAGGLATDGHERILDKTPESLHQRTPLFIGSEGMVRQAEAFLRGEHRAVSAR